MEKIKICIIQYTCERYAGIDIEKVARGIRDYAEQEFAEFHPVVTELGFVVDVPDCVSVILYNNDDGQFDMDDIYKRAFKIPHKCQYDGLTIGINSLLTEATEYGELSPHHRLPVDNDMDNSRYRVKVDGEYLFSNKPSLSKSMTALAIFQAYTKKHHVQNVQELREVFPCEKLNSYYYTNYYKHLFYYYAGLRPFGWELKYNADNKNKGKLALAQWDFYTKIDERLHTSTGLTMIAVKMWRKDDFDKLMRHIKDNPELFEGIEIEQVI